MNAPTSYRKKRVDYELFCCGNKYCAMNTRAMLGIRVFNIYEPGRVGISGAILSGSQTVGL
jgi:hypothetical protein